MSKKKDSLKPWLSRPAVNRSVTLPLTRPLTQRLSNLNEFHPNELDPYLLFDAQSSMLGTLEASTLDLDPSDPSTLEVITATRAGTATYTDASGSVATAPSDTVRVDHVDGVPMILVEPSATNLVTYSEDFSDSAWTKLGAGTGITAVVTSNYATSPDGTQNADRLQCDLNGGGDSSSNQSLIFDAYTSSGNQSISIYVKSNTGLNQTVYFANTQTTGDTITVTNEWQRFEFNHSSSTRVLAIGLRGRSGGAIDDTADILIWGAQAEAGSVATSYIPTSGGDAAARTRAKDDLVITGSDFDFYNQSEGTFYVEAVTRGYNGYFFSANNGTAERIISRASTVNLFVSAGGVTQCSLSYSPYPEAGSLYRRAVSYKANNFLLSNNGATTQSDTSGSIPTNLIRLQIGEGATPTTHLNGHIKRLIYWPTHSSRL